MKTSVGRSRGGVGKNFIQINRRFCRYVVHISLPLVLIWAEWGQNLSAPSIHLPDTILCTKLYLGERKSVCTRYGTAVIFFSSVGNVIGKMEAFFEKVG